jgi:hypothetical protein
MLYLVNQKNELLFIIEKIINKMSYGYIYCFSNESMPSILRIAMTERTPDIILKEANNSDTWRPPTPYKIEFAKKVLDPKQKKNILHIIMARYSERINPKREFFRISIEDVKIFFELIDGVYWNEYQEECEEEYEEEYQEECEEEYEEEFEKLVQNNDNSSNQNPSNVKNCSNYGKLIHKSITGSSKKIFKCLKKQKNISGTGH